MLEDVYPLSPLQEGLYYHWLSKRNSQAYFQQMSYRLKGKLHIDTLEKSCGMLVSRHAVLRTFFTQDLGDLPLQVVRKESVPIFTYKNVSEETDFSIEEYKTADRERGFDLHTGSQMRLTVLGLGDDTYEFIWSHHHILMDGWCAGILIREFFQLYYSLLQKRTPLLSRVYPYSNYIKWLQGVNRKSSLRYWTEYLSDYDTLSTLPRIISHPDQGYRGEEMRFTLDARVRQAIRSLCMAMGVTENTFIQIVWAILLCRYNNTNDVVFGSVVSGRPPMLEGVEEMIGLFSNTVPVRIRINEGVAVRQLLKEVQEDAIAGMDHHYIQLAEVQSASKLGRNLFDHILLFENFPVQEMVASGMASGSNGPGLSVQQFSAFDQSTYDLMLTVIPGEEITFRINYNKLAYDSSQISRVLQHLANALTQAAEDPAQPAGKIMFLSEEERQELLIRFNSHAVDYPKDKTLVSLFEEQAAKTPDNTALVFGEEKLTYEELDHRSRQLASHLKSAFHIRSGDLVGVMLDRSEKTIIAMLGILQAGGAYVPIDPAYPHTRKEYIIRDTNIKVLITQVDHIFDLAYYNGPVFAMDVEFDGLGPAVLPEEAAVQPEDLAYVIYTSGSTGQPKGVMIGHAAIVNTICCQQTLFSVRESERCLQFASPSFDASIWEIFLALASGAALYIIGEEAKKSPALFETYIETNKIDIATLPPAFWKFLDDEKMRGLRQLITAGEPAIRDKALAFARSGIYHNAYGPTESSICATVLRVEKGDALMSSNVPIGTPIPNTQIYIVNDAMALAPIGIPGEICIGGAGLAGGYWNNAALTAKKFVSNPFKTGERLYRTGDLGRWLPDGNIEFTGRKDDQVKIRGYRVEPGEIEDALQSHPAVDAAVVIARPDPNGEKDLVAFVAGREELQPADLRAYLSQLLPVYMLPARYVQLEAFPMTVSGKIDKGRLPEMDMAGEREQLSYEGPRDERQRVLTEVYEEVLKRSRIGIRDDFFVLGGDSIKSIQVVSRLKQRGYSLGIQDVMMYPVVEDLALRIRVEGRLADQGLVKGETPLGPIQRWFFEQGEIGRNHYNQSVLLEGKGRIMEEGIRKAFDRIVLHHDALRMVYREVGGKWIQENRGEEQGYSLEVLTVRDEEELGLECERIQAGMDLEVGPMLRAGLFRCGGKDLLLLVIHHLVIDGVSWRILFDDLSLLYGQYRKGDVLSLPVKTDSFKYWQQQLQEYALSEALQQEDGYWLSVAKEAVEDLRKDDPMGSNRMEDLETAHFQLDEGMTERLLTQCYRACHTEINDILLTGLSLAMEEEFGMERVLIDLEGHGREALGDVDVTRTVGWFTTVYPVVFDMKYKGDLIRQLIEVKERLHRVPGKGFGYGVLRYVMGKDYGLRPEVTFNYLGDFGNGVSEEKGKQLFEFSGLYHGREVAGEKRRGSILDVTGIVVEGRMRLSVSYSRRQYMQGTISRLVEAYRRRMEELIGRLSGLQEVHLSPVDLTYKDISVEQLSVITEKYDVEDIYPLSPLQEGLYYHWLSVEDKALYFQQLSYKVKGRPDISMLERSCGMLVSRHAVLRTFFTQELGDITLQVVRKEVPSIFTYRDVSGEMDLDMEEFKALDRAKGFDLHQGTQMRLTVLRLDNDTYEFIWSHHHILMDGWCGGLLIREFFQIYYSLLEGRTPVLDKVYPYSTYITWLMQRDREGSLAYWKKYLSGYAAATGVPKLFPDAGQGIHAKEKTFPLEKALRRALGKLSRESGVTENTFLQTAWAVLLSKYNDTDDVVFGSVTSGRPGEIAGIEGIIGLFINTIPVRIRIGEGVSVRELLKEVQQESIEGMPHHYVQLAQVQSESRLGRELFDHILLFENYPVQELVEKAVGIKGDAADMTLLDSGIFAINNYDFSLIVIPGEDMLFTFKYRADLYSDILISQLQEHLLHIIRQMLEDVTIPADRLGLLCKPEKDALLQGVNVSTVAYPRYRTIVGIFEEQVEKTPDSIALVFGELRFTYRELNELSNRLAHYLRETYEIKKDDLVGIMLDRSEKMIIAILGILKSGGAYVPVDPDYPGERKRFIVQDTRMKAMITQSGYAGDISPYMDNIFLADIQPGEPGHGANHSHWTEESDALAYVIYTSGSTGMPKGVMIEHCSLLDHLYGMIQHAGLGDCRSFCFTAPLTADAGHSIIFSCWLVGGALHILSDGLIQDSPGISSYLAGQNIDCLKIVPSLWMSYAEEGALLLPEKVLVMGGETFPPEAVKILRQAGYQGDVFNHYGPTETTIGKLIYKVDPARNYVNVPIGAPFSNTEVYVVDKMGAPCPVGVVGELWIGGDGVARGYLNQAGMTSEKFISNPFRKEVASRMYKTGDFVRWLPGGIIEYLGRKDDQVKIHGRRIEPGEIASALQNYPGIYSTIVLPVAVGGDMELVAYITGKEDLDMGGIQPYLASCLPAYMAPGRYIRLASMPLMSNGKLDKKKLPLPEDTAGISVAGKVALSGRTEAALASLWEEILGVQKVGAKDDFFMLGGHSLKAIRLAARIHKKFGVRLELKQLFSMPVLRLQAKLIDTARKEAFDTISPVGWQLSYPLSSSQRRLWMLSQVEEGSIAYNMTGAYIFNGELDTVALEKAFRSIVQRHEILRTSFREDEQGIPRQYICPIEDIDCTIRCIDMRNEKGQEDLTRDLVRVEFLQPFQLDRAPLVRMSLIRRSDHEWVFTYVMHHIVSDGWSMNVLVREMLAFYNAWTKGGDHQLQPLRFQYKDYAAWLEQQLTGERLQLHRSYWLRQLEGPLPVLNLQGDRPRPAVRTYKGEVISCQAGVELSQKMRALVHKQNATLFMGLLAVVNTLLYSHTRQKDIIIGTPVAGRQHADLEDQIGFYLNTLPLRTSFAPEDSFYELLSTVKKIALDAFEHQDLPFDELVDDLGITYDTSRNMLFDVWIVLHNTHDDHELGRPGMTAVNIDEYRGGGKSLAKFDLLFNLTEIGEDIRLDMEFNTDILERSEARLLSEQFIRIMESIAEDPAVTLAEIGQRLEMYRKEARKEHLQNIRQTNLARLKNESY